MNILKIIGIVMVFGFIMTVGSEVGERLSIPGTRSLVTTADAVVGRPLTPVSVAGVARRTVRRCAVGVYNCRLPGPQSLDKLIGQVGTESASLEDIRHRPIIALKN